MEANMAKPTV